MSIDAWVILTCIAGLLMFGLGTAYGAWLHRDDVEWPPLELYGRGTKPDGSDVEPHYNSRSGE